MRLHRFPFIPPEPKCPPFAPFSYFCTLLSIEISYRSFKFTLLFHLVLLTKYSLNIKSVTAVAGGEKNICMLEMFYSHLLLPISFLTGASRFSMQSPAQWNNSVV